MEFLSLVWFTIVLLGLGFVALVFIIPVGEGFFKIWDLWDQRGKLLSGLRAFAHRRSTKT